MKLLYKTFSQGHEVAVYEAVELDGEKGIFRVLQFSEEAVQGVMDMANPERVVLEYLRAICHLMEYNHTSFERVFLIGHGIGTLSRCFSDRSFDVAELDEAVVDISREWFGYSKDDVRVGDGRKLMESEPPHVYDYVVLDAFSPKGTPGHLLSSEFFHMAASKLDHHGSLIMNLMGRGEQDRWMNAIHSTLSEVFPYTKCFALPVEGDRDLRNIIMMGSKRSIHVQLRHMAGFSEFAAGQGYIIYDRS
ncbi:spermidine synthase [Paenibacillus ihumii]|uniref:spermidine synthase n=1 Tax=Paenibacillus ihumii TaxID=687436 RepID=UPI0006D774AC|nr:fused MFS/spermidine synthase [Paenibacillus ihumii]